MRDIYLCGTDEDFNAYAKSMGVMTTESAPRPRVSIMRVAVDAEWLSVTLPGLRLSVKSSQPRIHIVRLHAGAFRQFENSGFDKTHPEGTTVAGLYRLTGDEIPSVPGGFAGGPALERPTDDATPDQI